MNAIQKLHSNIELLENEVSTLNKLGQKILWSNSSAQTIIGWTNQADTTCQDIEVLTQKLKKMDRQLTDMKSRFKEQGETACDHNSDGCNSFR